MIKFYLKDNNNEWTEVDGNVIVDTISITLTIDETLDYGSFQFVSNTVTDIIKPFSECKIVIDNKESFWYASSDMTKNVQTGRITHDVRLIEPTKRLEKVICQGLSFYTTKNDTEKYTIRDVLYKLSAMHSGAFDLPFEAYDMLSPEFEFEPGKNLLECLKEVGYYIGGMPRLTDFRQLTFDSYNKRGGEIVLDNYEMFSEGQREEDYCAKAGDIYSNMYSSTGTANIVEFPSADSFVTPRSTNIIIDNDNADIILPSEVYIPHKLSVTGFKFNPGLRISIKGVDENGNAVDESDFTVTYNGSTRILFADSLDITDYLVAKADYDILEEKGTTVSKENRIYYDKNIIGGLAYYPNRWWSGLSNTQTIINIITRQLKQTVTSSAWFTEHRLRELVKTNLRFRSITSISLVSVNLSNMEADDSQNIFDIMFNFAYQASVSGYFASAKDDVSNFTQIGDNATTIVGQASRAMNLTNAGRASWASTQKLGNTYRQYLTTYSNLSQVPAINSVIDDDYVLTTIKLQWLGDKVIKGLLQFDKNFNRLSEFLDLNQRYKTWDIEKGDYIRRLVVDECYVVVANSNLGYVGNIDTNLATDEFKWALTAWFNPTKMWLGLSPSMAVAAVYHTGIGLFGKFGMMCNSSAFGKSLMFNVETYDNVSMSLSSNSVSTNARSAVQAVYVDDVGKAITMTLFFRGMYDSWNNASYNDKLNYALKYPKGVINKDVNDIEFFNVDLLEACGYDKSAGEALSITRQYHIVGQDDFIVGFGMTERNALINKFVLDDFDFTSGSNNDNLKLYAVKGKINPMIVNLFDTYSSSDIRLDKELRTINDISVTLDNGAVKVHIDAPGVEPNSPYKSWAIVDKDGLVFIACNNIHRQSIYFNFTKEV